MPISRRNVGRPKKTQPNESDQPATHRFFSLVISDADRAQEKDVTIDERDDEPVNRSSKKRKVFLESDDSDDDFSDADRAQEKDVTIDERDDEPVNRSSKKRKVFLESDDSDDDFGIVIENRQSHVAAEKGDTEDNINEAPSSSIPHKSIYLYQANIPSTSMVSPLPDISRAINSTALKYLSDAELGRLAAQHSRQTETSGGQVTVILVGVCRDDGGQPQGVTGNEGQGQDVASNEGEQEHGDTDEFTLDSNHNEEGHMIVLKLKRKK